MLFRSCLWRRGHRDVEVLRTEVDAFGYDLVIETGGVLRHIQLKASHRAAKTAKVGIGLSLAAKPSGCVVWMLYDSGSLELGPFRWFGGRPGEKLPPLGDKVVKHTKGNAKGEKANANRKANATANAKANGTREGPGDGDERNGQNEMAIDVVSEAVDDEMVVWR